MKRIALLGSLLLAGCASTVFESRSDLVGDFFGHENTRPTDATPHLFIETAPDDFSLAGDGTVLYDKARFDYLGKVHVRRIFDHWRLGFSDFNEPWRRYYCPPAVVLTYGTAFALWATGLPIPCMYETASSNPRIEERKKHIAYAAVEQGMRIGATHLVFAKYTATQYMLAGGPPLQADNDAAVSATDPARVYTFTGMTAHAFKRK